MKNGIALRLFISILLLSSVLIASEVDSVKTVTRLGLGIGLDFGWTGLGLEVEKNNLAFVGGLGIAYAEVDSDEVSETGWYLGAAYYLRDIGKALRPSLKAGLGTTHVYFYSIVSDNGQSLRKFKGQVVGVSISADLNYDFGGTGGVIFTVGGGVAIPVSQLPQEVRDLADELNLDIDPDAGGTAVIGIRYQF